jgi:hypothetical protein
VSSEEIVRVRVARGESRDIVFNFGSLVQCQFRIDGWRSDLLAGISVTLEFWDLNGAPVGTHALAYPNALGEFVVAGRAGNVVSGAVFGARLVGVGSSRSDFDLVGGPYVVCLPEKLATVRIANHPSPVFAHAGGEIRAFDGDKIVFAATQILDDIVVCDLAACYCVLAKKDISFDAPNWATLGPSTIRALVEVDGEVRAGTKLVLFGPEPRGRPSLVVSKRDPRRLVGILENGRCSFGPLVPGYYSLRWDGDAMAPGVLGQYQVGTNDLVIRLPGAMVRAVRYRVLDWIDVAKHIEASSCRLAVDDHSYSLSDSGEALGIARSDAALARSLRIVHPSASFCQVGLLVDASTSEQVDLRLQPDVVVSRVRIGPTFGGDVVLVSSDRTRLQRSRSGDFVILAPLGESVKATIIEFFGGRKHVVGFLSYVAGSEPIVIQPSGRWVDINIIGLTSGATLKIGDQSLPMEEVGRVGSSGVCRVWVPNAIATIAVERDGLRVASALVGEGVVAVDVVVK